MNTLYVLYDAEGASSKPVYGIFTDFEFAVQAKKDLAIKWADEMLADDPTETGLDASDRDWLIKDCERIIGIQEISDIDRVEETR